MIFRLFPTTNTLALLLQSRHSKAMLAEELPNDALVAIFNYLRPTESICCRGVCRKWSKSAGSGTIQIQVKRFLSYNKLNQNHTEPIIASITLCGRVKKKKKGVDDNDTISSEERIISFARVRGHLTSPASQTTQDMSDTSTAAFGFACDQLCDEDRTVAMNAGMITTMLTSKHPCSAAAQIEDSLQFPFTMIDLGSTSSKFQYGGINHRQQAMICSLTSLFTIRY